MCLRKIVNWLKLPEAGSISDLDDASTTLLHAKIIQDKKYLTSAYFDAYCRFREAMADRPDGLMVELGSGGGFIKEVMPEVISSDISPIPDIDLEFSGLEMPFRDEGVAGFFMFGVLHHIPDAEMFFREIDRCLKISGKVVMVEPAMTLLGGLFFRNLHPEPADTAAGWALDKRGRLSSANLALPWIIFCRDRSRFEKTFPSLRIVSLKHNVSFCYLLSGGLSYRQFLPSFTLGAVRAVDNILSPFSRYLAVFMTIELEKVS